MASKFVSHRQPILVEWNLWQPFRSLAGVKGKPCFFERQEGICFTEILDSRLQHLPLC